MSIQKEIATNFLKLGVGKNVPEAYEKYVHKNFKHHNQHLKGDAQTLMQGMIANAEGNPHISLTIKQTLEEGDRVMLHSHMKLKPTDLGVVLIHIFRFQDNKIIELWDLGQPLQENSPNENGMF